MDFKIINASTPKTNHKSVENKTEEENSPAKNSLLGKNELTNFSKESGIDTFILNDNPNANSSESKKLDEIRNEIEKIREQHFEPKLRQFKKETEKVEETKNWIDEKIEAQEKELARVKELIKKYRK